MLFPLVSELPYQDPCQVFAHFHEQEGAVFLDSALTASPCGRYSFIGLEPFQVLSAKNGLIRKNEESFRANPFTVLQQELKVFAHPTLPDLPPFQGGVVAYWGYELAQHLEKIPLAGKDLLAFPDLIAAFYDLVLAFDQQERRAWIFSSGFPELESSLRKARAEQRLQDLVEGLKAFKPAQTSPSPPPLKLSSNFSSQGYQDSVQKTIDYILAGDIFQANISQCFSTSLPSDFSAFELYQRLRHANPAPFAAYLHFAEATLLSASPERFLKLKARQVETRPIKGTCSRGTSPQADQALAEALLRSEKDRAENIMIVDLLRNDLSKVCEAPSVQVPQLCALESYATVHHLVSVVTGTLAEECEALDLLKACFPGGSVTGAPKIRAMEIIAELEPTQRGPYCGSIGYLGFDGNMDSSITIRTYCLRAEHLTFQAGGAIVADSKPLAEYEETLIKAKALLRALGAEHDTFN